MKTNQNESPHTPTGNAFNAAVAKILGQSDDGKQCTWTVPTDLGRLHIGITIDDGLGMTFLDAPAPEKLDEIGADRFTSRWNIAAESLPDPEMRLRELVKRLARVGWVPVVKAGHTPGPWTYEPDEYGPGCVIISKSPLIRATWSVRYYGTDEESRKAIEEGRINLEGDARLIAAAPLMLEALQNLENDGATMPGTAWKLVQDAIKAATI